MHRYGGATTDSQQSDCDMKLGFVGTGALTSAIVTGLKSVPDNSISILLSPRNEEIAAGLAAEFKDVRIASSNQEVLDGSDVVMLAVRPQIAADVLPELTFRPDHMVISLMATISLDEVQTLVMPARQVSKALPMPMVARRIAPTIVYPPSPIAAEIFGRLGKVIPVDNAGEFDALSVVTATFATYFQYLDTISTWVAGQGVAEEKARDYVAGIFKALAHASEADPKSNFEHLAKEYATRGGINEQVVRELGARGVFRAFSESLDNVHRRIIGASEQN